MSAAATARDSDEHAQQQGGHHRPASIDLTLELEHQLSIDSPLSSPNNPGGRSRPQSLDPHVLASIVTQLRDSLVRITKERDDLVGLLSQSHAKEAGLKDALETMTEKCEKAGDELEAMKAQQKEDQDTITNLRAKVRRLVLRVYRVVAVL
jgi:hypothetical protein